MSVAKPEGYNMVHGWLNKEGVNHMPVSKDLNARADALWRSVWPTSSELWNKIKSGPKTRIVNANKFQKSTPGHL